MSLQDQDEEEDQDEEQLTTELWGILFNFSLKAKSSQSRGEFQAGIPGMFKKKGIGEISWRVLLNKLFSEGNVRITCK